jgi:hypothetical protein
MAIEGSAYSSKELRWFFRERQQAIEDWFNIHDAALYQQMERHDFYLDMFPSDHISFKLREGKTEIKLKSGGPDAVFNFGQYSGYAESWLKWSLSLKNNIDSPEQLYDLNMSRFIEIIKRRSLVMFEVFPDAALSRIPAGVFPAEGCQVEYTSLQIKGESWFSFSFEAFGSGEQIDRNFNLVTHHVLSQLAGLQLKAKDSYSYPVLLKSFH